MNDALTRHPAFASHPDPMWVFDPQSLRLLEVNDTAVAEFGYSRDEFLAMTIADLRPPEDREALAAAVRRVTSGLREGGHWRMLRKSGERVDVEVRWHTIEFDGERAVLASVRNITRLVALERERQELTAHGPGPRLAAADMARSFESLFEAVPGKFLVLTPDRFEIVAVSDAYLEATMTRRAAITGRPLFEVFPDDPDEPGADGTRNLRASLERVKASGVADVMAVQRYPVPRPADRGGGFEERFWSPINTPVKGPDGAVAFIIHRVEDVTGLVRPAAAAGDEVSAPKELADRGTSVALDVLLRSQELQAANRRLGEQGANLRMAQRLLGIGIWKIDTESGALWWSDNVYDMYGIERARFGHSYEAYVALVHPDDRDAMAARYAAFAASPDPHFEYEHRIVRPADGRVIHVRGAGELTDTSQGRMLTGVVQDITQQVETEARLSAATSLLRIAGRAARLGGWRVHLDRERVVWTAETAAIHEVAEGTSPTLDEAFGFYVPEHRDRMRTVFRACAEHGEPFDEVRQLVTAKGNRLWVRAIGEAVRAASGAIVAVQGAFQEITELVEARERSEELSRRLMETVESISDAFLTMDGEWRFTFLNGQAERLLDRSRTELIGKVAWEAFREAAGSRFQTEYERAVATGQTARFTELYAPLGKWLEINAHPTAGGLAVYFRDVTQTRAREEQLRLLETAVSRQSDILMITEAGPIDGAGAKIVYVNDSFVRRTGYSREETLGNTPRMLQGPRTQQDEIERIGKAQRQCQPVRGELIHYTRSGEEMWVELDIVPIADDTGRCTHWVAIERDITERRRAEEAIRASEERFHLLARATNDVVWDWDLVQGTVWWNEAFRQVFGYDSASVPHGPEAWTGRIHPDDRERVAEGIHAVIDGGGTNWSDEYRFQHADGRWLTVFDRGFVIRDASGSAVRMLGSMIDRTEQRELDARLRQAQKLEAIGQLTGGIAHDFNNLLTVILGNAEVLSEQLAGERQLHPLAEMTATAAERGAELTSRLLAFARRQALDPRLVDLNRLAAGLDRMLRRTLAEDIEIKVVLADGLWPAEVDLGQLEVALLNLAINARDAMPDGGRLIIETANVHLDEAYARAHEELTPGPYVMVAVSDTGSGMPPDVVARAFEPFFTTKEVGKGSGLGLSMVYGFVKQSGGHAKIYSEVGLGTAVRLYFPRADAGEAALVEAPQEQEAVGGDEHILVVEDDDLVREHLIAQLEGLGYRVLGANAGPRALEILRQDVEIDLLFTDVVMPGGMNGRELADLAQALRPGLRVLFTSGYSENAIVHHSRLDRGVHLLGKPWRRQEMAAKVRMVLDEPGRAEEA